MRRQWKSTLRVVLVRSHVTGPKGILVNQHGSSETAVNQFHASRCNAQSRLTRLIWARSRITLIILVPSRVTENPFATLWIEFGSWVLIWVVNPIQSVPIQILSMSILNTTWKQQNNIEAKSTSLFENGDFFLLFKKIRDHTLRFWIAFARAHENAIVTKNGTIFDGSMRIYWYFTAWRNFVVIHLHECSKTAFTEISTMERAFEKMLFWQFSGGNCGQQAKPRLKISVLKQTDSFGRGLNANSKW